MINLWEYEYSGKVKIVDIDGVEFIGEAQEIIDIEERAETEEQEISITVKCESTLIEFCESEIKTIEKIS